jgi:hypothetical protein
MKPGVEFPERVSVPRGYEPDPGRVPRDEGLREDHQLRPSGGSFFNKPAGLLDGGSKIQEH